MGSCALVGAGPGDPELLTLKATAAMAKATVVYADDLVHEAVLAYVNPQAFIEKRMIHEVRQGEHVVRLKSGDPFIFGRGGEEVQHLQAAGIAVEVVNGITAGLAAMTSLKLPLTHREHAHGVLFATGHARSDASGPDWAGLANMALTHQLTLVIYIVMAGAQAIERGLLQGLAGHTPLALIQNATLPDQQQAVARLDNICGTLQQGQFVSLCVIVVGDMTQGYRQLAHRARQQSC
jgi:uroporphyrin-III C-methyltransferase